MPLRIQFATVWENCAKQTMPMEDYFQTTEKRQINSGWWLVLRWGQIPWEWELCLELKKLWSHLGYLWVGLRDWLGTALSGPWSSPGAESKVSLLPFIRTAPNHRVSLYYPDQWNCSETATKILWFMILLIVILHDIISTPQLPLVYPPPTYPRTPKPFPFRPASVVPTSLSMSCHCFRSVTWILWWDC